MGNLAAYHRHYERQEIKLPLFLFYFVRRGWTYVDNGTDKSDFTAPLSISTGGPEVAYQAGGFNAYSMSELTKPFQATANLTGMRFLPTFTTQGVRFLTNDQIRESAEELVRHLKASY